MPASPEEAEIARWMLQQYQVQGRLAQSTAALQIRGLFGQQHVYKTKNGSWAINESILEEFRKLTPDDTVWRRGAQTWQRRSQNDRLGRLVR